jgi:SAM-dependent methyltransferase
MSVTNFFNFCDVNALVMIRKTFIGYIIQQRSNEMGSSQKQGDLWGQAPSDWATIQEPKHIPLFNAMLDAAGVGTDTHLLDAGCGGGGAGVLAAQRGAQVSGLDASDGLIKIAQARVPSGDFHVGDIEDLPFENDTFDAVIAPNSVQYAEDRIAALRELGRVCKPDGRVVVGLFGPSDKVEYSRILQAIRRAMPEPPPGDGPFDLSADGKLEGLIEDAGLKIIESDEVNCPFIYPDFETFWRGHTAGGPSQSLIRIMGEETMKSAVQEASKSFTDSDGRIVITPNFYKYVVATVH